MKVKLADLGAKRGPQTRQVDVCDNAPHRDFLAPEVVSEWLRVRTEERGSSVHVKVWHPIDAVAKTHAAEYEAKVDDPEAIRRMLEALGFRQQAFPEPTVGLFPFGAPGGFGTAVSVQCSGVSVTSAYGQSS